MIVTDKPFMFLQDDFKVDNWELIENELRRLKIYNIHSKKELENFIDYYNELLDEINNEDVRNYVQLSLNTSNLELANKERDFSENILSRAKPNFHQLEKKIVENPYYRELGDKYTNYKKMLERNIRMFSKENIELHKSEQALCLEYRKTISNITLMYNGNKMTLSQIQKELLSTERNKKEEVWRLIRSTWLKYKDQLDDIFDQILQKRREIAKNSGFETYSKYMHSIRNRFDYKLGDISKLNKAIEKIVIPVLKELNRCQEQYVYPWEDEQTNSSNILIPFSTIENLIEKNSRVLEKINPNFAKKFNDIHLKGNLDLEVRKGKTPGGFCFPIDRTGACFICMNITGKPIEANILIHESGHGIHSVYQSQETIREYKMFDGPGELTELPPKILELLAIEHYDQYYQNVDDIKAAKKERLLDVLVSLRKYSMIDTFEQWLYANPNHKASERLEYYKLLEDRFNVGVNWSGLEEEKGVGWYEHQLLVTMPHYVISYAMAQIGAIAVYRNYKEDKRRAIEQFENVMQLGFSRPITDLYEIAGAKLDFSEKYLNEMIEFIVNELNM